MATMSCPEMALAALVSGMTLTSAGLGAVTAWPPRPAR